jgi:tetratricopeptide (TPR) repeat protein
MTLQPDARLSTRDILKLDTFWDQIAELKANFAFLGVIGVDTQELREGFIERIQTLYPGEAQLNREGVEGIRGLFQDKKRESPLVILDLFPVSAYEYKDAALSLVLYRDYILEKDLQIVVIVPNGLFAEIQEKTFDFLSVAGYADGFEDLMAQVEEWLAPPKEVPENQVKLDGLLAEIERLRESGENDELLAFLLNDATEKANNLGKWELAISLAKEQKGLSKPKSKLHLSADISIGSAYYIQGNYQKAFRTLSNVKTLIEHFPDSSLKFEFWLEIIQVSTEQRKFELAAQFVQKGITLAQEKNNEPWEGDFLAQKCTLLSTQGKKRESIKAGEEAQKILKKYPNSPSLIFLKANLTSVLFYLGQIQKPLKYAAEALFQYKKQGLIDNLITALNILAGSHLSLGNWKAFVRLNQASQILSKEANIKKGNVAAQTDLGFYYYSIGKYSEANNQFHLVLQELKKIPHISKQANLYLLIAATELENHSYQKASTNYQKAQSLYKKLKHVEGLLECQSFQGTLYRVENRIQKAIEFHKNSLFGFKKLGWMEKILETTTELAIDYFTLEDYEKSLELQQEALKIARELGFIPDECLNLGHIGLIQLKLGNKNKALRNLKSAMRIATLLNYAKALKLFAQPLEDLQAELTP